MSDVYLKMQVVQLCIKLKVVFWSLVKHIALEFKMTQTWSSSYDTIAKPWLHSQDFQNIWLLTFDLYIEATNIKNHLRLLGDRPRVSIWKS